MTDRHPVDALCLAAASSQGSRAALVSRHVPPSFALRAASRLVRLHDDAAMPEGMLPDGAGRALVLAPAKEWLRKEMVDENDGWLAREGGKGKHAKVLDRTDIKFCSTLAALKLLLLTLSSKATAKTSEKREGDEPTRPPFKALEASPVGIVVYCPTKFIQDDSAPASLTSLTSLLILLLSFQRHLSSSASSSSSLSPIPLIVLDRCPYEVDWPLTNAAGVGPERRGKVVDVVRHFFPSLATIDTLDEGEPAGPAEPGRPITRRRLVSMPGHVSRAEFEVLEELDSEEATVTGRPMRWTRAVGVAGDDDDGPEPPGFAEALEGE